MSRFIDGNGRELRPENITGAKKLNLQNIVLWHGCPQDKCGYISCRECNLPCNEMLMEGGQRFNMVNAMFV